MDLFILLNAHLHFTMRRQTARTDNKTRKRRRWPLFWFSKVCHRIAMRHHDRILLISGSTASYQPHKRKHPRRRTRPRMSTKSVRHDKLNQAARQGLSATIRFAMANRIFSLALCLRRPRWSWSTLPREQCGRSLLKFFLRPYLLQFIAQGGHPQLLFQNSIIAHLWAICIMRYRLSFPRSNCFIDTVSYQNRKSHYATD